MHGSTYATPELATESSSEVPAAIVEGPTFADTGLSDRVLQCLNALGYNTPTPVQAAAIPPLLAGKDVIGQAQTGTGKTAAFALPLLSRLDEDSELIGGSYKANGSDRKGGRRRAPGPSILVLAPTRELAQQVAAAFEGYGKHVRNMSVVAVYGGAPYGPQLKMIDRGASVVVGTPGRLMDLIERGALDLSNLDTVVLDEADEMLRMGFLQDVTWILDQTPQGRQIALFSATMPDAIARIARKHMNEPVDVRIKSAQRTADTVRQRVWEVQGVDKVECMARVLETEEVDGVIVFVRTRAATVEVADQLHARGFKAQPINGDMPQESRERAVSRFKRGGLDVLVATDIAARGLDVDRISHVINYDVPFDPEAYIHRIGRTGRAGRKGEAILMIYARERRFLKSIQKHTRQPMERMDLPSADKVNAGRIAGFREKIESLLNAPGKRADDLQAFEGLIHKMVNEPAEGVTEDAAENITVEQVAAALAVLAQGDQPLLVRPDRGGASNRGSDRGYDRRDDRGEDSRGGSERFFASRDRDRDGGRPMSALERAAQFKANQNGGQSSVRSTPKPAKSAEPSSPKTKPAYEPRVQDDLAKPTGETSYGKPAKPWVPRSSTAFESAPASEERPAIQPAPTAMEPAQAQAQAPAPVPVPAPSMDEAPVSRPSPWREPIAEVKAEAVSTPAPEIQPEVQPEAQVEAQPKAQLQSQHAAQPEPQEVVPAQFSSEVEANVSQSETPPAIHEHKADPIETVPADAATAATDYEGNQGENQDASHKNPDASHKNPDASQEATPAPPAPRGPEAGPRPGPGYERFQIAIGHDHKVTSGAIVKAIADTAGLTEPDVRNLRMHERCSTLDLPAGMPREIFRDLKKRTKIGGFNLMIKRVDDFAAGQKSGASGGKKPAPRSGAPFGGVGGHKSGAKPFKKSFPKSGGHSGGFKSHGSGGRDSGRPSGQSSGYAGGRSSERSSERSSGGRPSSGYASGGRSDERSDGRSGGGFKPRSNDRPFGGRRD